MDVWHVDSKKIKLFVVAAAWQEARPFPPGGLAGAGMLNGLKPSSSIEELIVMSIQMINECERGSAAGARPGQDKMEGLRYHWDPFGHFFHEMHMWLLMVAVAVDTFVEKLEDQPYPILLFRLEGWLGSKKSTNKSTYRLIYVQEYVFQQFGIGMRTSFFSE